MIRFPRRLAAADTKFYCLAGFLLVSALIGGGSREDIVSLILLRPLAFLLCGFAILSLDRAAITRFRSLFALAIVVVASVALYLVPLPPAVWGAVSGRDVIAQVDKAAQLGALWRPLSMDPLLTWNALFSLSVPMAVLLLATHVPRSRHRQLIAILIVVALVSGTIGILQILGPPTGSLYFYRITNSGAAVGLFSNRNHHAIFLAMMLPMLAVFASAKVVTPEQRNRRLAFAFISGLAIISFILSTGSRNGLIVGVIGTFAAWRLYDPEAVQRAARRKAHRINFRPIVLAGGAVLFALLVFIVLRGQAVHRLINGHEQTEFRFQVWMPVLEMVRQFFPFGAGPGAFALPYQIVEPSRLLSTTYLNHAHNDWLELIATMGVVGTAVLAFALVLIIPRMFRAWSGGGEREDRRLARLGAVECVLIGVASAVDYPLRTPSLMAVFVLSLVWLWTADRRMAD